MKNTPIGMPPYKSSALNQLSYGIRNRRQERIFKVKFFDLCMLIFGHAAAGYLIVFLILKMFHSTLLTQSQINVLYIIGMIAAIIPDLDTYVMFYKHKSMKLQRNDSHRKYISHTLPFWFIVSILIFLFTQTFFGLYISLVVFLGALSHLIGDSIEYGIMWFWPFSKKQYSIHKIPKENINMKQSNAGYYWKFFNQIYIRNWTFYVEIILIVVALIVYFNF